jgi:DNA-binding transcriptional MocR family regulator
VKRLWRKGSEFEPGLRESLTHDQRKRFAHLVKGYRENHHLTPLDEKVALALLGRLSKDGQCDPSHARIADDAKCSERTVRRALVKLKALGLVDWQQRIERDGHLVFQTTNSYALRVNSSVPLGGQIDRETVSFRFKYYSPMLQKQKKEAYRDRICQSVTLPALSLNPHPALLARQKVIEARLASRSAA